MLIDIPYSITIHVYYFIRVLLGAESPVYLGKYTKKNQTHDNCVTIKAKKYTQASHYLIGLLPD